jgi:hypothetical protein
MQLNYFERYQYSEGTEKPVSGDISEISDEKKRWSKWPRVHNAWRFCTKNRTVDQFVTSDAHVLQVVWPVNQVCKMCDLSAHARQVIWSPVSFTLLGADVGCIGFFFFVADCDTIFHFAMNKREFAI